jgi:hypothetical protein
MTDPVSGPDSMGPPLPRPSRRSAGRTLAITAVVAALVVAGAVVAALRLSSSGHPSAAAASTSGSSSASAAAKAEAQQVLSRYATVNNEANEQYSSSLLGTVEGDSSYAMDTGSYLFEKNSSSPPAYTPFGPLHAEYYIPDQPADTYPHWFLVAVTYASLASPKTPTFSGYLLFSKVSARAPWLDVFEPNLVSGGTPGPQIVTDAQGYATAVSPGGDAAGLSIAPGQIGQVTAAEMDKTGAAAITMPSNLSHLSDESDQAFWQSQIPAGSTESLKHQAGPAPVFGLRTQGGGAILFYYVNAELTLVAPAGSYFTLQIPGFYSASSPVPSAVVPYIDQFAAYDPPKGQAAAVITADASGYSSAGSALPARPGL